MLIINPYIFKPYPELLFGFSSKIGLGRENPYYFNMSFKVGDDNQIVTENRKSLCESLGLKLSEVAYQKQVHGDSVAFVNEGGLSGESDALITTEKDVGLAMSTADCCAVFIYDPVIEVIAGVHSGWRGTDKDILVKVLQKLSNDHDSNPGDLICYLAPSISQANYEVGPEVAEKFDLNYLKPWNDKFLLNIPQINYDTLINFGVFGHKIQMSCLCTFEYDTLLHSYRRDGKRSGRAFGIIAMKSRR
jgi:YfiH family protein